MGNNNNITRVEGVRYGRMVVLREAEPRTYRCKNGYIAKNRQVEALCDCGNIKIIQLASLQSGNTQSCGCYHKECQKSLVFGVGVNDYEGLVKIDKKTIPSYKCWYAMLSRCYNPMALNRNTSYIGCSVCPEWLIFTNFKRWFDENYIENYALDKDILVKGNKIYSPNTCCFVPQEINKLFIKSDLTRGEYPIGVCFYKHSNKFGASVNRDNKHIYIGCFETTTEAFNAYKIAKEQYIKDIADRWRDKIDKRVYDAMCNYKVEITD